MAHDDKIEGIGGISSRGQASKMGEAGAAQYEAPPPPPPPKPQEQANPLDQIQDKVSISSFDQQQ